MIQMRKDYHPLKEFHFLSIKIVLGSSIVFTSLFTGCINNKTVPKILSRAEIQYVLFNHDGTLLITEDYSETEPNYWDPRTASSAARPDTFFGRFEKIVNNLGTDLIIAIADQKRILFDALNNSPLGAYIPEDFRLHRAIMISPK